MPYEMHRIFIHPFILRPKTPVNLWERAKTRVQVVADMQNFASCAHCVSHKVVQYCEALDGFALTRDVVPL